MLLSNQNRMWKNLYVWISVAVLTEKVVRVVLLI